MHPKQPIEQTPRKDRFGRLIQDVSVTENGRCHCGCTSHPAGEKKPVGGALSSAFKA
ncbi:hypothetical protein [Marinobacterium stanieri]|uniref:hypothetical protein n=1 Tax=Marinobacterium stanieri TaxID=49186 RepID=UPI003A8CDB03